MQFDVWVCRKSKMAAINRKWIGNSNNCTPLYLDQATGIDYWEYCPMSGHVVNQKWRPFTGSNNVNNTDA